MRFKTIALLLTLATVPAAAQTVVNVNAAQDRHRINPNVYGTNLASEQQLLDLNSPLNRSGGNPESRYNWQEDATNRGRDWFFLSIGEGNGSPGNSRDEFIADTKGGGAQPMMTIPTLGWSGKLGPNRGILCSFPKSLYPGQTDYDWDHQLCGTGLYWDSTQPDGTRDLTGNDPNNASRPTDVAFQRGWVQHMISMFGLSNAGGVRYYIMDNEPSIWFSTHRDVHPQGASMDEVFTKMRDYSAMVKSLDPNALVAGPEEWGWSGYFWSGSDLQWSETHCCLGDAPDRVAHGRMDYVPWLLSAFHNDEQQRGRRLLDIFTLHYYPQGINNRWDIQEYQYGEGGAEVMQLRNRSTRSLWDRNYIDASWIQDNVRLIPRMKEWVDRYYPLTPVGLTEYSWGSDPWPNGGTAQADIFGILGRENIDLATRWVTPSTNSPAYSAMKIYRNYDGNKSTFGDISVRATVPNPDNVAAFAALRSSDKAMTVMLINKQLTATAQTTVNLAGFTPVGTVAQRWSVVTTRIMTPPNGNGEHITAVQRGTDVAIANAALSLTLPPQSVTLLVIPGAQSADVVDPVLTLVGQTVNADGRLSFTGTASDASGIARVTYRVSTGDLTEAAPGEPNTDIRGTATGTNAWSVGPIRLTRGWNYITFTAWDNAGNPKSIGKQVVHEVMGPPPVPPAKNRRRSTN
ncbi:MAG TPA: glycoside hydrolase family 44 protein [Thermoanaerobaculia bacterium]